MRPSQYKFWFATYGAGSDKGVDISTCIFEQTGYYALKVPDSVFVDMENAQAEDLDRMLENEHSAMQVLLWCIDEWVFHVD